MKFNIMVNNGFDKNVVTNLIYAYLRKYRNTRPIEDGSGDEMGSLNTRHGSSYTTHDYWIEIDMAQENPEFISNMLDCLPVTYEVTPE